MTINKNRYFKTFIKDGISYQDILSFSFLYFEDYLKDKMINVVLVQDEEVNSPDLISYNYYGISDYWWIICFINKIKDPFVELTVGKRLFIPKIEDIENFIQKLDIEEISQNNSSTVNI